MRDLSDIAHLRYAALHMMTIEELMQAYTVCYMNSDPHCSEILAAMDERMQLKFEAGRDAAYMDCGYDDDSDYQSGYDDGYRAATEDAERNAEK